MALADFGQNHALSWCRIILDIAAAMALHDEKGAWFEVKTGGGRYCRMPAKSAGCFLNSLSRKVLTRLLFHQRMCEFPVRVARSPS
ncbi:MAG: hypothetical protein MZV64_71260 [Ignavibacteriales bacterium]|nr:hypothetical protein [Ignavibacteriales bacterium]